MNRRTLYPLIAFLALLPMTALATDGTPVAETKSPIELWNTYAAIGATLLTAVMIRKGWSKGRQATAAVIASVAAALVGQWITDGFASLSSVDAVLAIAKVVTLAQISYQTLFQAIPLPQWIESKTGGDDLKVTNPHNIVDKTAATGEAVRQTG